MADIYLDSVTGNDADDGSTRALAKALMSAAVSEAGANGRVFVDDGHAESDASTKTITLSALATPTTIISVDFAGTSDPSDPVGADVSVGAKVTTTGSSTNVIVNGSGHIQGVIFDVGVGGTVGNGSFSIIQTGQNEQITLEDCAIRIANTDDGSRIFINNSSNNNKKVFWKNVTIRFADARQKISMGQGGFIWESGGIEGGGTEVDTLFSFIFEDSATYEVNGVDLSGLKSTADLLTGGGLGFGGVFRFRNDKLPANWTGSLFSSAVTAPSLRGEMINCDDGDTNYRLWIEDWLGVVRDDIVVVRTNGASDGTTSISHKYTTDASCNELQPFHGHPIESEAHWDDIGSELIATLHYIHDGADARTNAEIWGQVETLGTSGFPLATFADDKRANVMTATSDKSTSTEAWDSKVTGWVADTVTAVGDFVRRVTPNGTVMICIASAGDFKTHATTEPTWPAEGSTVVDDQVTWRTMRREKIDVPFTPQEKGVFLITPMLGKASITTLFLCPLPVVV